MKFERGEQIKAIRRICQELGKAGKVITRRDVLRVAQHRGIENATSIQLGDYCDNKKTGKYSIHKFLHWVGLGKYLWVGDAQEQAHARRDQSELVDDLREIERREIKSTTKDALISARVGQGTFRIRVLQLWENSCAVTSSVIHVAIRASHIKPWRESTDEERLDPENGLPLVAGLDALFDAGLISFDRFGRLIVSSKMTRAERKIHCIEKRTLIKKPSRRTSKYLADHRRKYGFQH